MSLSEWLKEEIAMLMLFLHRFPFSIPVPCLCTVSVLCTWKLRRLPPLLLVGFALVILKYICNSQNRHANSFHLIQIIRRKIWWTYFTLFLTYVCVCVGGSVFKSVHTEPFVIPWASMTWCWWNLTRRVPLPVQWWTIVSKVSYRCLTSSLSKPCHWQYGLEVYAYYIGYPSDGIVQVEEEEEENETDNGTYTIGTDGRQQRGIQQVRGQGARPKTSRGRRGFPQPVKATGGSLIYGLLHHACFLFMNYWSIWVSCGSV